MKNRLSQETSPYLLQHQDHPVDWYPWGQEALLRAREENKPILLSVGYSACHWCHVMAHECFENAEIAHFMNQNFINIKVDREERPDLDQIYQNVAQAMTRGGGWPLTVFLTPDLQPFFGGTYFPPEDRYGRPGFPRVLAALSEAYQSDRSSIQENAQQLMSYITRVEAVEKGAPLLPVKKDFEGIVETLLNQVDWVHGGMGGAPKFPSPMIFEFLWRWGKSNGDARALEAVRLTLNEMAGGGIYDQIGGGFHRYSVDATWSVPHFEKMLYDQALILKLYAEVLLTEESFLSTQERERYLEVILQTTDYLTREMLTEDGLFMSAQDADSEGEEGKFFVWDQAELKEFLSESEFQVFSRHWGVSPEGNFEHGKTVLFHSESLQEIAQSLSFSLSEVKGLLQSAVHQVLNRRSLRVAPGIDDKVLTSWNALMISGLTWGAQALRVSGKREDAERLRSIARKAMNVLVSKVKVTEDGSRLFSTFQRGKPKHSAYLDDYAYLIQASLDLARSGSNPVEIEDDLNCAHRWMQTLFQHFKDDAEPGFFFTSDDHEALIHRPKTLFDQAIPAGTSVVLQSLAALAECVEDGSERIYGQELEKQISLSFESVRRSPYGCGQYLSAALQYHLGVVMLSGVKVNEVWKHPHIYQKKGSHGLSEGVIACHRGMCSSLLKGEALFSWIDPCLRFSSSSDPVEDV